MKRFSITIFGLLCSALLFAQSANFMVFSDPHYYDPSLGVMGEAFQNYLDQDRKLLRESGELIDIASELITESKPDFLIVPGDLTKDGTLVSHQQFADRMKALEKSGIPVFVVPGNHDISNGESNAYKGTKKVIVKNVNPEQFSEIYADFGYSEAIRRDIHSLSYVAEPVEGLWIFGLDACLYEQNQPKEHPITDGEFSPETLEWIEATAKEGKLAGKRMIAMMHHGIIEHYPKQDKFYGEYVVNDFKKVSKMFAESGLNVVFTGHYHAQDITKKSWSKERFIFDVETGSLVTYPCPIRQVELSGSQMSIQSILIQDLPSMDEDFAAFSREYAHSGIAGIAEETLVSYRLKRDEAKLLSGQIADAFLAHYQGDEPVQDKYLNLKGVGLLGRFMILFKKRLVVSLYTDLPPADNQITIDLDTGNFK